MDSLSVQSVRFTWEDVALADVALSKPDLPERLWLLLAALWGVGCLYFLVNIQILVPAPNLAHHPPASLG